WPYGAMDPFLPPWPYRLPDDDLRHVSATRITQEFLGHVVAGQCHRFGSQLLRQSQGLHQPVPLSLGLTEMPGDLNVNCDPFGMQARSHLTRRPDQAWAPRLRVNAHHNGFRGRPSSHHRVVAPVDFHLLVDPLGRAAQCELSKGDQIAFGEEMLNGTLNLLRDIDLPF